MHVLSLNMALVDKLICVIKSICAREKGVRAVLLGSSPENNTVGLPHTIPSFISYVIIIAHLIIQ